MLKYFDTVDAVELVFSNVQELMAYAESYRGALNDGYKSWDDEFIAEIKTVADAEKVFDLLEIERVETMKRFDMYSVLVANGYKLPAADAHSYVNARIDILAFMNENDLINDDERLKVAIYKDSQWRKLIDRLKRNGHKEHDS